MSAVAALCVAGDLDAAPHLAPAGTLTLKPCSVGKPKVPSMCGTFTVYEDRAAAAGRTVTMNVVIFKAKHESHRAIAEISGGPGQAATDEAETIADGGFAQYLLRLRDEYDIVFLDARGMGAHGFGCHFATPDDPAAYMRYLFADATVRRCMQKNAVRDRALYNTDNAVDDLDALRAKLGYGKFVLNGGSYGTFFSLIYMRRHPESVAAAILNGVAAPGFAPLPGAPDGAQRALDDIIAACSADPKCRSHYPQFADHFNAVIHRFDAGAVMVSFKNPAAKKIQKVALSKEVLVDRVRDMMYDPDGAAALPFLFERAYNGDYVPLATAVSFASLGLGGELDLGAMLSYSCQDLMPFLNPDEVRDAAEHSFTGDLRIRAQRHACVLWNVPAMPAVFNDPVTSDIPALLVTGSDDPATPPQSAERALPYLRNARQVLVRNGGH
ncbi:MAG: alpha/beta hydrolase, partial [Candidatus Eremiobacteraeota bacterium]|nr:alpha/beta hydrolase [Candidatus Eremiobacteraeota bacterium]